MVNLGKTNNISSALSNKYLEIIYFLELLLNLKTFNEIHVNMEIPKSFCRKSENILPVFLQQNI